MIDVLAGKFALAIVGVYILERECKTTTLDRVESGVSKRQFIGQSYLVLPFIVHGPKQCDSVKSQNN